MKQSGVCAMNLFEVNQNAINFNVPLAEKMRPQKIEEIVGQEKVLGMGSRLKKMIDQGYIPSLIIWGPPGSGKTTFAHILAGLVDSHFEAKSAIDAGVKELRSLGEKARIRRIENHKKTILFVDEIHRFNKSQQDILLPFVEKGDFTLVGATTENPSYEINKALLSRCELVVFDKLNNSSLQLLIERAFMKYGYQLKDVINEEGLHLFLEYSDGDARRLLNNVEGLMSCFSQDKEKKLWPIGAEHLSDLLSQTLIHYDKKSDSHYDTISAFIKSIRGSDPDASLYYLARMLKAGEDPKFIARRLVILASEDIGNADPKALGIAVDGFKAVELVGLPECSINLAQITTYLATAPKSNASYKGLRSAQEVVNRTLSLPIPLHLRSSQNVEFKKSDSVKGYKYSHEGERGWVFQEFLPEALRGHTFYEPVSRGYEKHIIDYMSWLKQNK